MTEDLPAPDLHRMLRRLEGIWADQGMPVVDHLAPGISAAELARRLAPLGLEPPDELCTWFGWHNGLFDSARGLSRPHVEIVPAGLPLSVDAAIRELRLKESIAAGPPVWQPGWFPIVGIHHGAAHMVDCRGWPHAPAPVLSFDFEEGGFESDQPRASSLTEVVSWWLEYFEDGTCFWDPAGYIGCDEPKRVAHGMERILSRLA